MRNKKECLVDLFYTAYRQKQRYIAVKLSTGGVLINPHKDILDKIKYYESHYDEGLRNIENSNVSIVKFTHGNSYEEIERILYHN